MKRYTITWIEGYATADDASQDVGTDFFTEGNGFDADDIDKVEALLPCERVRLGGPLDIVEIQRLQDKAGPGDPRAIACTHGLGFNCKKCYPVQCEGGDCMTPYVQWLNSQSKFFRDGYEAACDCKPDDKGKPEEWRAGYRQALLDIEG